MIYPRTNVLERRKDVTRLLVKGFTPGEIAKGIGVSRETVYNDVRYIRSGQNEDLAEYGRKQMLAQVMLNARERVRELWSVVEKSESPYVKLLALRELRIHDQQTLNHIFLFTQIGEDNSIEGNNEEKIDAENVSQSCQRAQPAPASDDLVTNRQGRNDKKEARDLSESVNLCRKSFTGKDLNLQTDNGEAIVPMLSKTHQARWAGGDDEKVQEICECKVLQLNMAMECDEKTKESEQLAATDV